MSYPQDQFTSPVKDTLPLIFIIGNSYSGSTLLGFILSSSPEVFYLGEIKSKNWNTSKWCSCGLASAACPFYGYDFDTLNASRQQAIQPLRMRSPFYFLFTKKKKLTESQENALLHLNHEISRRLKSLSPGVRYWVDSSKSLWMLNAWSQIIPAENLKILWIRRSMKANIGSFVKRGAGFWPSFLGVVFNQWMIKKYLAKNKMPHLVVAYDRFLDNFENEAAAISSFLKIKIEFPETQFRHHHVISGNKVTRRTFMDAVKGFNTDEEWKTILTPFQKKIISWIS